MALGSVGERLSSGVKARVMASALLSDSDYRLLLASSTVAEVAQKLMHTPYAAAFSSLPADPHRDDIEAAVKKYIFEELRSLSSRLLGPRRALSRALLLRFDAENIKMLMRSMARAHGGRESLRGRMVASGVSKISYDELISCSTFAELAEALASSPFARAVCDHLEAIADGRETKLYSAETALDIWTFRNIAAAIESLEPADRRSVSRVKGEAADMRALNIIYRARTIYGMRPEAALAIALPLASRHISGELRSAAAADAHEAFVAAIARTKPLYAKVFSEGRDARHPALEIERAIMRFECARADAAASVGVPGLADVISYFVRKEAEAHDLIMIVEAVRYDYDRRDAHELLIRRGASGGGS